jgi:hypothetical protein
MRYSLLINYTVTSISVSVEGMWNGNLVYCTDATRDQCTDHGHTKTIVFSYVAPNTGDIIAVALLTAVLKP